jgi:iron complex transport system ATP-binding protein
MGIKLEVKNADFRYFGSKVDVFKGISFTLSDGDNMCILGPNGCGKTTLLKCIANLLTLTGGEIIVDNHNIGQMKRHEIAKNIGYIPQLHTPTFPYTVLDAVLMGRTAYVGLMSTPSEEDIEICRESLRQLNIYHLCDRPYTEISGGERQMVMFARVLAQQSSILLLDEPTSHLDFGNQNRFLGILKQITRNGLPSIMTSHFPDHVFLVANKVAIINKGKFLAFGTPEEVVTEENLYNIYGIKVKVLQLDSDINRKICVPID